MSAPSSQDISEMQKLINLMNGQSDVGYTGPDTYVKATPQTASVAVDGQADMKRILESFYQASGEAVETTNEVAKHDRNLREAMGTTRTTEGAIIGSWEVRVKLNESNNGRKSYDVLHAGTKDLLFKDLVIFEAAHAIVRYLNKGLIPEHRKIEEIADLEETYRRNRQDAVVFKKRYERCLELKESEAGSVFEARYQKARAQAIVANDQIKTILDNIR